LFVALLMKMGTEDGGSWGVNDFLFRPEGRHTLEAG
jgi:hypothetical protein